MNFLNTNISTEKFICDLKTYYFRNTTNQIILQVKFSDRSIGKCVWIELIVNEILVTDNLRFYFELHKKQELFNSLGGIAGVQFDQF